MPKTLFQNIVFTLMMSFLMVYAMICYNISLNTGGMSNSVFLAAFHELIIMWPVAFLLEFLFVDKAAHALAFRFVKPDDRPIIITLAISTMIICIMCPCMSLVATILFKHAGRQFAAVWLQTTFLNFPVAFFWQLFYCGPIYPSDLPQAFSREISLHKQWIRVPRQAGTRIHYLYYEIRESPPTDGYMRSVLPVFLIWSSDVF